MKSLLTIRSLAAELELEFLEFHDRLLNEGQYFPDGIHPDGAGTALDGIHRI